MIHGNFKELRILPSHASSERGVAIALEFSDQKTYEPFHDLFGHVFALLNSETPEEIHRYSAFGEEKIFDSLGQEKVNSITPWTFCSKRKDKESSLIFFGRRYYEPSLGRFLTPDPEGFTQGMNLYSFVLNDPLRRIDLFGLWTLSPDQMNLAFHQATQNARDNSLNSPNIRDFLNSPRIHGSFQAMGGLAEASFGGGFTLATEGFGAPVGFAIMAHGFDQFSAGMNQLITGKTSYTLTEQVLQKSGLSPETAAFYNNSISTFGSLGAMGGMRFGLLSSTSSNFGQSWNSMSDLTKGMVLNPRRSEELLSEMPARNSIINTINSKPEEMINTYLGEGTRFIKNKAGDSIFISRDNMRRVRFDFINPAPHNNPHVHVEQYHNGNWHRSGPIYPFDVPPN